MKCLENYIGLRSLKDHCEQPPPISGLYLEDLEGMTVANLASIESGKAQNVQVMFDQLLQRCGRIMMEEIKILLQPYLRTQATIEGGRLGKFSNNVCNESELKIETCLGALQRLVIEEINVKFTVSGEVVLTLTDGDYTETKTITSVAGEEQTIQWFYVAKTNKVSITAPVTGHTGSLFGAWRFGSNAPYKFICCNQTTRKVCGITAAFTIQCNYDAILCATLPHLNYPLLYSLGIEVLKEWESSTRLNFLTIHGKEWAADKREEWQIKRNEMIVAAVPGLASTLQSIDRKCVTCGGYSYAYAHP